MLFIGVPRTPYIVNMRRASRTRLLLAAAGLAGLVLAAATPVFAGPATDRLREFFGKVNTVLDDSKADPLEKVARVKRLVTDIADVRSAAAGALDHQWNARTPAERDEFTRLFAELLERGLVARLAGTVSPVNGMVMSWSGETRVGDEARVMTVVESRDGRKIIVEYRMTERRGRWLVRDVVVDGISTVENYRAQFKRLLRQGSYADLVKQLRTKIGEETRMFAQATPSPATAPRVADAAPRSSSASARVAARASAPAQPIAKTTTPQITKATGPQIAKATTPHIDKTPALLVAKATPVPPATASAPSGAKPPAAQVAALPSPPQPLARSRVAKAAMVPVVLPPPADVVSPLSAMEVTTDVLPSVLLVMLGFVGVSGAVYLRRRASAPVLLQHVHNADEHVVVLHPAARVAKVRERGRKRRHAS